MGKCIPFGGNSMVRGLGFCSVDGVQEFWRLVGEGPLGHH